MTKNQCDPTGLSFPLRKVSFKRDDGCNLEVETVQSLVWRGLVLGTLRPGPYGVVARGLQKDKSWKSKGQSEKNPLDHEIPPFPHLRE